MVKKFTFNVMFVGILSVIFQYQASSAVFLDSNGRDPRQPMLSADLPWSAVGRLYRTPGIKDTCTGTLVGRRIMLTAAHCVLDKWKPTQIHFQPNHRNGFEGEEALSEKIEVGSLNPVKYAAEDWAVVFLNKNLGDKYGFLDVARPGSTALPQNVFFSGYSSDFDKGETATWVSCYLEEKIYGYFGHNCSMNSGSSGGALFYENDGHFEIIGVNVRGAGKVFDHYTTYNANHAVWTNKAYEKVIEYRMKFDPKY